MKNGARKKEGVWYFKAVHWNQTVIIVRKKIKEKRHKERKDFKREKTKRKT